MTIKKKVGQLIKKHDTNNPFEIAKALDMTVVFEPLGDSLGYFSRFNRTIIIHINESLPHEKQLTTCAHELGHAILHSDLNTAFLKANTYFSSSRAEKEANEFMIELLFNQEQSENLTIHEATAVYGVPEDYLRR